LIRFVAVGRPSLSRGVLEIQGGPTPWDAHPALLHRRMVRRPPSGQPLPPRSRSGSIRKYCRSGQSSLASLSVGGDLTPPQVLGLDLNGDVALTGSDVGSVMAIAPGGRGTWGRRAVGRRQARAQATSARQ